MHSRLWPLLVLLFLSVSPKAHGAGYHLLNMGPDFKVYVDKYRHANSTGQWRGWKKFENKYQIYFDQAVCDSSLKECEKKKQERLKEFFVNLPTFESSMWEIFSNANALCQVQVPSFLRMFPDAKQNIPVVFMPSLLSFNGRGGLKINGTYTLAIGADLAALRKNDMGVLFSHEFFHTYHFEKLKKKPIYETLASPLWFEGLATWASSQLNPQAPVEALLMNQDLAAYCASKENIKTMAKTYKPFLTMNYTDTKSTSLSADWFSANGELIPHRRGYCLGFYASKELTKVHSTKDILALDEASFSSLLNEVLENLRRF